MADGVSESRDTSGPSGPSGVDAAGAAADVGGLSESDTREIEAAVAAEGPGLEAGLVDAGDGYEADLAERPDVVAANAAPAATDMDVDVDVDTDVAVTEPLPENRAKVEEFRDRFEAIDIFEGSLSAQSAAVDAGDPRSASERRADVLDELTDWVHGIEDPEERDNTLRAIAIDAGRQAGKLAEADPYQAYEKLDALGAGMPKETGGLLAYGALETSDGVDKLPALARSGTPVGDALVAEADRRADAAHEAMRAVVPGYDGVATLLEGDVLGAGTSLAIDAAGGAILKSGKLAAAAVGAGIVVTPGTAEAGPFSKVVDLATNKKLHIDAHELVSEQAHTRYPVVTARIVEDGQEVRSLTLMDPRAKHNIVDPNLDPNLDTLSKQMSRNRRVEPQFKSARANGQFTGRWNTPEGQAELAEIIMKRLSDAELDAIVPGKGSKTLKLPFPVGLTPQGTNVRVATSIEIKRNANEPGFHLVPRP
ncbi:MAG: hypothetical protein RMA76_33540 [Deltaproteobacteria bacterium]|jgi:hypothetical protein